MPYLESIADYISNYYMPCDIEPWTDKDYRFQKLLDSHAHLFPDEKATAVSWKHEMPEIARDQGPEGSCIAFGVLSAKEVYETRELKLLGIETKLDLSEQFLYQRCKFKAGGSTLKMAGDILRKDGVCLEAGWPYNPTIIGTEQDWAKDNAKVFKIKNYYFIENLEQLKIALRRGPVPIVIEVFSEWFNTYQHFGMIPMPANVPTFKYFGHYYHCVDVYGFDDSTGMVYGVNSYGPLWGNLGDFSLFYSYINKYMYQGMIWDEIILTQITPELKKRLILAA